MIGVELSIAGCLLGVYALFLVAMFGVLWMRASSRRRRGVGARTHTPEIRDALVDYLSGSNDQTRIREYARDHRTELVDTLLEFHGTVGGSARDRLCDLTLELSLVHDWCQEAASKDQLVRRKAYTRLAFVCAYEPCRRVAGDLLLQALKDADPEVRLPAARALVQSGSIDELGHVFRLAVSQSLLIRILLAEDLRRHATELCAQAIPQVLAGDNPKQTVAALQILIAWERALPLPDLHKLLESDNREVRLEALRLAKLVPLSAENRSALLRFLREGDEEENTLAALTAGRLRLQEALPSLARCLRTGTSELAGIAASALAEMPPKGWQTLQQIAGGTDSAALIAAAALDRGRRKAGV
jgi:HEAT repeat protein